MKRCLNKNNVIKLQVPNLLSNFLRRYENHVDNWKDNGPFTDFSIKMILGCIATGFMVGGYLGGKDSRSWNVTGDTIFGCCLGSVGGLVAGIFWPTLPFVPIPYVMYKGVRVLVDRKRKQQRLD